jgi:hypothetical protein
MERKSVSLTTSQLKELGEVITSLVSKYKTEYIYCFSCFNQAKTTTSCFTEDIKLYIMEMLTTLFRAKLTQGLADFWVAANAIKACTKIVI